MLEKGTALDLTSGDASTGEACERIVAGRHPGAYALIQGRLVVRDYQMLGGLIDEAHSLAEAAAYLAQGGEVPDGVARKKAKQAVAEGIASSVSKEFFSKLGRMLQWMYGDRLILQTRPAAAVTRSFETDLDERWLRYPRETLRYRFGMYPAGTWYVFCQIASGAEPEPLPMVEGLDDPRAAIERFFDAWRPLVSNTHVHPPVVAITPIAIYRRTETDQALAATR